MGKHLAANSSIIPLSRVQHVSIEQDVIQKKLGISDLAIVTAGDANYIIGLLEEDTERLRRQVVELPKIGDSDAYGE